MNINKPSDELKSAVESVSAPIAIVLDADGNFVVKDPTAVNKGQFVQALKFAISTIE